MSEPQHDTIPCPPPAEDVLDMLNNMRLSDELKLHDEPFIPVDMEDLDDPWI